jgi:hypothetical protein
VKERQGKINKVSVFFQVAADYPGNELYFRVIMQRRQFGWELKLIAFFDGKISSIKFHGWK